jgi:co-chaperonin GroES (HSP10)
MDLKPVDDYIILEEIIQQGTIHLLNPDANQKRLAKVLAVGKGAQRPDGGRFAQPCDANDTVLVHAGAGFRYKHEGEELWFVQGGRGDIIAVVS